jgi:hypothetical protein
LEHDRLLRQVLTDTQSEKREREKKEAATVRKRREFWLRQALHSNEAVREVTKCFNSPAE